MNQIWKLNVKFIIVVHSIEIVNKLASVFQEGFFSFCRLVICMYVCMYYLTSGVRGAPSASGI